MTRALQVVICWLFESNTFIIWFDRLWPKRLRKYSAPVFKWALMKQSESWLWITIPGGSFSGTEKEILRFLDNLPDNAKEEIFSRNFGLKDLLY